MATGGRMHKIRITLHVTQLQWIRDLNVKPDDSLNLIEENVEIHMHWGPIRPTINKRVLMRLKNFCTAKNIIIFPKWQPTEWGKCLYQLYTWQRWLMNPPTKGLMSTGPKKLWQHAQNLYKLKSDTIPAWRRGSEQSSPLTQKLFGIARRGKVGFLQWSDTGCINHTQGRQHLRDRWTT